jgi:GMP synthase-like glutamine amidotransferase
MAERVVLSLQNSQITVSLKEITRKSLPKFLVLNAEPELHWD